jgi:hypothetical protein
MPFQTGLPAALRRWGLKVETIRGWETRGSSAFTPRGALCHWTAGPANSKTRPSLNICTHGRSDLPGPLCQVYLARDGVAVVVAAGRANHAGAGNWRGLTGNSVLWGTEAEAANAADFTAAQRAAYPRVNAAFATLSGFGAEMVAGHSEFALPKGRKVDVNGYTMDQMRQQVAALLANPAAAVRVTPEEDDMPDNATIKRLMWEVLMQEDVRERLVASVVRQMHDTLTPGKEGVKHDGDIYRWARDAAMRTAAIEAIAAKATPAGPAVSVDAAQVASALAADRGFVTAIAEETAGVLAERLQS